MTEDLYEGYSEADSEPVTNTHQTRNEDCPYIKLLVPTKMTSLLRIPTCTILNNYICGRCKDSQEETVPLFFVALSPTLMLWL